MDRGRKGVALPRMTLLDRAIAVVAPGVARQRVADRYALDLLASYDVERVAGGRRGTMQNWTPRRLDRWREGRERETITDRAADLLANDAYASGAVDTMAVSVVGTGLRPQSQPNVKRLGITREQGEVFAQSAEWAWQRWSARAAYAGWADFSSILFSCFHSLLATGDFVCLQPWRAGGEWGTSLQPIDPRRMRTPADLQQDARLRDGVELDAQGAPVAYWIAQPDTSGLMGALHSKDFLRVPVTRGGRQACYHRFLARRPEQVRGVSALAPAVKTLRDHQDWMDFELVAQIVSASFPLVIKTVSPWDAGGAKPLHQASTSDPAQKFEEYEPGQVLYLDPNQEATPLVANRPGAQFEQFVERVLRGVSAALLMPYEVLARDFSKTNYSSARAALLEAWRVYALYRHRLVTDFCRPVWGQVLEEAYWRGELELPAGAPDYYEAREAWEQARWIAPPRGHIDPVKERQGQQLGMQMHAATLADVCAEDGQDWEDVLMQQAREQELMAELGLSQAAPAQTSASGRDGAEGKDDADRRPGEREEEE